MTLEEELSKILMSGQGLLNNFGQLLLDRGDQIHSGEFIESMICTIMLTKQDKEKLPLIAEVIKKRHAEALVSDSSCVRLAAEQYGRGLCDT